MLTAEQRTVIEENLKQLSYSENEKIFGGISSKLNDEIMVFIGLGGTGTRALIELKNTIKKGVSSEEIFKKTKFLAIDSDWGEIEKFVEQGELSQEEILGLPYIGAHSLINPDKIPPHIKEWVHPNLWATTGGKGADFVAPPGMNGTGSGAIRQCGRVLFTQPSVQSDLYMHLSEVLIKCAEMGNIPKIKVFFLTGIAGGTGSGAIIDLAYLCRYYLKILLQDEYQKVTLAAYLFSPDACGYVKDPSMRMVGQQNAYAAMKEIDYYMTIVNRGEAFCMNYGTPHTWNVEIRENIFDFCTLVDGIHRQGAIVADNAAITRKIVAESILNTLLDSSSSPSYHQFGPVSLVDSFFSNRSAQVAARIAVHSDKIWPRDTNYIYNVIGYNSCVVPRELLTMYVAKKVFDEVFRRFRIECEAVEARANDFLQACGLGIKEISKTWATIRKKELLQNIQEEADREFVEYGPYYMTQLTRVAAELLERAEYDYLRKAQEKKNGFLANKEKYDRIEQIYKMAIYSLMEINGDIYEAYAYSFDVLKEVLEKNTKILTETEEYTNMFKTPYQWSPIDLTPEGYTARTVIEYLDNLMTPQEIRRLARLFLSEACDKKDKWTGLAPDRETGRITFDVAKEIRDFISDNLQTCVAITMEELLVKVYSGNPDAPVTEVNESGQTVYSREMEYVAHNILGRLREKEIPLANVGGISLDDTYHIHFLVVPQECVWLYQALVDIAYQNNIDPAYIFKGEEKDRIIIQSLYSGIPAWSLSGIREAERVYETIGPERFENVGLHIEQSETGVDWNERPKLCPENVWFDHE